MWPNLQGYHVSFRVWWHILKYKVACEHGSFIKLQIVGQCRASQILTWCIPRIFHTIWCLLFFTAYDTGKWKFHWTIFIGWLAFSLYQFCLHEPFSLDETIKSFVVFKIGHLSNYKLLANGHAWLAISWPKHLKKCCISDQVANSKIK